jgi:hypothetical protein
MSDKLRDPMGEGTEQRLQRILRGAFAGPPTKLKDIPKKSGESRAQKRRATRPEKGQHASK